MKTFTGILQADAYGGYNPLFRVDRDPGPLTQALCWSHARRKFFVLADIATNAKRGKNAAPISPMALEAVKRMDALFDIEQEINGLAADAAERALRGFALGRKSWLVAGSDRRAERAAFMATLIMRDRSAGLACRRPRQHCGHAGQQAAAIASGIGHQKL